VALYLDDAAAIDSACESLATEPRLALDTEFLRERTYEAQLALVQLAGRDALYLVDPLVAGAGAPLAALLSGAATKVLHAARQDVEVLLPLTAHPLAPILDTQIAAALLGHPAQIGYADLVGRILGVTLEKASGTSLARTDWTRRPLSPEQLSYATDDVRYLLPLSARLEEELAQRGRLGWLHEDCRGLEDAALYASDPADAWRRLKGIEALPAPEQRRLRVLARWREERARQKNLPRAWVLSEEALRALARDPPARAEDLMRRGILKAGMTRLAEELTATLAAAAEEGPEPEVLTVLRPSPEEQARSKRLAECVKARAGELGLAPEVLATQKDLRRLARGEREIPPLEGWRRAVVGDALLEEFARG
jgi:ribonuclease D